MQRKVMISCALTGAADSAAKNPAVPVTPEQIAASAIDAAKAGAAIVHIHVRDPKTGLASMDGSLYAEAVDRIRQSGTEIVINLTTGPGGRFAPDPVDPMKPGAGTTLRTPRQRVQHVLGLRPEICSLDMGSMNMGPNVFVNTPPILEAMATDIREAGVMPELEVFETGHLLLAKRMIETGHIKPPGMFQICLGISWGQPATPEAMSYMRTLLPPSSPWFAFGISLHQFPIAAQAVLLGGHPRVGLEDNLYLEKGKLAPSNAALVEKAARIVEILGDSVATPAAALANAAMAHAFEMDNLTWPNTGVHPGATLLPPGLAVAQERGIGGRDLIAAVVAGAEVMIRIGRATQHRNESRGFHAPGTTGPFGAAIAAGRLIGLDATGLRNALGVAGSLACGLMEFARSGTGAMVKRLHLGRAAESGVLAAGLASDGFTAPVSVLEGEFGFLRVFCGDQFDSSELTRGLGQSYASRSITLKRFPCHITAHTSVQAILDLRAQHDYAAQDVSSIHIAGNEKMAGVNNNIPSPADIMMA